MCFNSKFFNSKLAQARRVCVRWKFVYLIDPGFFGINEKNKNKFNLLWAIKGNKKEFDDDEEETNRTRGVCREGKCNKFPYKITRVAGL